MAANERVTIPQIRNRKGGEAIVALTAFDYMTARIVDEAGVDIILVGDTLGMVFQGNPTTLPVRLQDILYHTRAVLKGARRALVVSDLPFLSYQVSEQEAIRSAGRALKAGAHAVKMEGGTRIAKTTERLVELGIPVMGHIGMTPQSVNQFGGFRMQGRERENVESLLEDARTLDAAGCFSIVVEAVPEEVGELITKSVSVPTIGIGAGDRCDGQILVTSDLLGLYPDFRPWFVEPYANLGEMALDAVKRYREDVRTGKFPAKPQRRHLKDPSILKGLG